MDNTLQDATMDQPGTNVSQTPPQPEQATPTPYPKPDQSQAPDTTNVGSQDPTQVGKGLPMPADPKLAAPHNVFKSLFETLAGGPKVAYKVQPDGTMAKTETPLTGKSISAGILAGAITGMMQGMGKSGPDSVAQSAQAGFQGTQQQAQQQDAQKQQTATADFARQAGVTRANMEQRMNSLQASRYETEDMNNMVKAHSEELQDLQSNPNSGEMIKASNLTGSEAMDVQKYPVTQFRRVPDGTTTVTGTDGKSHQEVTYSIVDKDAKSQLVDDDGNVKEWVKTAVQRGQLPESILKSSKGATLPADIAGSYINKNVMFDLMDSELKSFSNTLGKGKDGKPLSIDLNAALKKDPKLATAIQQLQRTSHGDTDINKQLADMAKDPKAAPYAAQIVNLFGQENIDKLQAAKDLAKQRQKEDETTRAAVDRQQKLAPGKVKLAYDEANARQYAEINASGAKETARLQATKDFNAPVFEDTAQGLAKGDEIALNALAGLRANDPLRMRLNLRAKEINPAFNPEDTPRKIDLQKDFLVGKGKNAAAPQINSANAFLGHSGEYMDSSEKFRHTLSNVSESMNKPISYYRKNFSNDTDFARMQLDRENVVSEYTNLLAAGYAPHAEDKKRMEELLSDNTTFSRSQAIVKEMAAAGLTRLQPLNDKWKSVFKTSYPAMLNEDSVAAIKRMNDPNVSRMASKMASGGTITGSASGAGAGAKNVGDMLSGKTQVPPKPGYTVLMDGDTAHYVPDANVAAAQAKYPQLKKLVK